jgi:hypothetical protein
MTIADAARDAGFRKPPDAFRTAQRAWAKMIPEERDAFEDFIADWRRRHGSDALAVASGARVPLSCDSER